MTLKEKYDRLIAYFEATRPDAGPELHYADAYQLLVAVVLSAQCTDKRVNMVTPALFAAYPDAHALSQASADDILHYIRSVSYPNSKSAHLAAMARKMVSDFGGEVPSDIDALQQLPGVGRKTANVIASVIFNQPALAVDTHVFRVAERLGLTHNSPSPLHTERTLTRHLPADKIPVAHHWLILHGRYVCQARKPKCDECGLTEICRFYKGNGANKTNKTNKSNKTN